MRRLLPRTLARVSQPPHSRIQIPRPPSRAKSTIPLLQPPSLTSGFESAKRTAPQKVAKRRETWPPHPKISSSPLSDPDLLDIDSEKGLPGRLDEDFQHFRDLGLYPGEAGQARVHFLDGMRAWRNRIRGEQLMLWDSEKRAFVIAPSQRIAFLVKHERDRGREYAVSGFGDLEAEQLPFTRRMTLRQSDFDQGRLDEVGISRSDVDPLSFDPSLVDWAIVDQRADVEQVDRSPFNTEIVGFRIYLPNIIVRLVRNHTPPGQPYDPYIATFRINPSMTKTDLRSYLKALYGLDVTFIRTDIYWGEVQRHRGTGQERRLKGSLHNYKRAVVGLYKPFHYPDDIDELEAMAEESIVKRDEYERRTTFYDRVYNISRNKQKKREIVQQLHQKASERYRAKGQGGMGMRMRAALQKRREKEVAIDVAADRLRQDEETRQKGEDPDVIRARLERGLGGRPTSESG